MVFCLSRLFIYKRTTGMEHKNVILTESQYTGFCDYIIESNFYFNHKNVGDMKRFLDRMCYVNYEQDIEDGYPKMKPVIYLMNPSTKEAVRPMEPREVLLMMDDKYPRIIKDDTDRKLYLKQVIIDWFDEVTNRKPHKDYLSVNFAKRND